MKAFKTAILILGPIVLIVGIYLSFFRDTGTHGATQIQFFNIMSGELLTKPTSKIAGYPDLTDDDFKPYLYPLGKDSDGNLVIHERFRGILKDFIKQNKVDPATVRVDMETFRIKTR